MIKLLPALLLVMTGIALACGSLAQWPLVVSWQGHNLGPGFTGSLALSVAGLATVFFLYRSSKRLVAPFASLLALFAVYVLLENLFAVNLPWEKSLQHAGNNLAPSPATAVGFGIAAFLLLLATFGRREALLFVFSITGGLCLISLGVIGFCTWFLYQSGPYQLPLYAHTPLVTSAAFAVLGWFYLISLTAESNLAATIRQNRGIITAGLLTFIAGAILWHFYLFRTYEHHKRYITSQSDFISDLLNSELSARVSALHRLAQRLMAFGFRQQVWEMDVRSYQRYFQTGSISLTDSRGKIYQQSEQTLLPHLVTRFLEGTNPQRPMVNPLFTVNQTPYFWISTPFEVAGEKHYVSALFPAREFLMSSVRRHLAHSVTISWGDHKLFHHSLDSQEGMVLKFPFYFDRLNFEVGLGAAPMMLNASRTISTALMVGTVGCTLLVIFILTAINRPTILAQALSKEVKEKAREIEAVNQKLAASYRELQQFAYVASHDLQEPLRKIRTYATFLQEDCASKLDRKGQEHIANLKRGAERATEMIRDLLQLAQIGSVELNLKTIDTNALLRAVVEELELTIAETKAQILYSGLPLIQGDESQLQRLFSNLLSNAIKYRGDRVPEVVVEAESWASSWHFLVRDNGIGIDPQDFQRVFLLFQRLHGRSQYQGSGIGLSICNRIVERHQGRIWVESDLGNGSVFHFTIAKGLA